MNTQQQDNPLLWLGKLSDRLFNFQQCPNEHTKADLLESCGEYQKLVNEGLAVSRTIPEPNRRSNTLREWYQRLLGETMAMYRVNPSDDRYEALKVQLNDYQQAVAMGRVKP